MSETIFKQYLFKTIMIFFKFSPDNLLIVLYNSQGHKFYKLLFSTFQKYYILEDGGKVSVLW